MKQFAFVLCIAFSLLACQSGTGSKKTSKTDKPEMVAGKRCSFDLPSDLYLIPIDTSKFSPDGYYKIHSRTTQNTLQIFVFEGQVDTDDKVANQVSHINSPGVFEALKTDSMNTYGQYRGKGVMMTGLYEGGVVNGKIRIFSGNGEKRGFLVIRQHVAGNDLDQEAFELLEKSFLLK